MARLRISLYNNSTNMPTNLSKFDGQVGDMTFTPATKWWTYAAHPEIGEFNCWKEHTNYDSAKQWKTDTLAQHKSFLYEDLHSN